MHAPEFNPIKKHLDPISTVYKQSDRKGEEIGRKFNKERKKRNIELRAKIVAAFTKFMEPSSHSQPAEQGESSSLHPSAKQEEFFEFHNADCY